SNKLSWSLFSPGNTLAALLANNFNEAGEVEVGVLLYAALVLMAITLSVNIVGTALVRKALANLEGTK
ncbi:MAG: phosphate ABC transporter permease subunit PstC, partial [Planctomycetota bacterium]